MLHQFAFSCPQLCIAVCMLKPPGMKLWFSFWNLAFEGVCLRDINEQSSLHKGYSMIVLPIVSRFAVDAIMISMH
jgi:hypothetical protein